MMSIRTLLLVALLASAAVVDAFLLPHPPCVSKINTRSRSVSTTSVCSHVSSSEGQAAAAAVATAAPSPAAWTRFDPEKAIKLAAFSFATYGDPSGSRWLRMPDGTNLGFKVGTMDGVEFIFCGVKQQWSAPIDLLTNRHPNPHLHIPQNDEVVRRNFRALLLVHILTAQNLPQESGGFIERALSGGNCDPYVITSVANSFGADVAITRPKAADSNPEFYERFFLYVEDPGAPDAALDLTVKDRNLLKGDDVIGACRVPLSELRPLDEGEEVVEGAPLVLEWSGVLDIVVRDGLGSWGCGCMYT